MTISSIPSPAVYLLQQMNNTSSSDLVSILNGQGTTGGGDPVAALTLAEKNQAQGVKAQQNDPQTKAEINRFLSVVSKAKDLKTILADPIAQKVLLTANGLGDQVGYTALVNKALMSDPSQSNNFASTLSNSAYSSMVKTYNFAKNGLSVLQQPSVLQSITTGYATVQWQQTQDQATPGLSAALDFRSRASTIKNVDQILGDANFRTVVTGALGIPQQIAFQSLTTQEKAITSRLDVTKLQDPKFVENLAREFLINNQASSSSTSPNSITSLFA